MNPNVAPTTPTSRRRVVAPVRRRWLVCLSTRRHSDRLDHPACEQLPRHRGRPTRGCTGREPLRHFRGAILHRRAEKFRSKVRFVRPSEGAVLRDLELANELRILERLEDRSPQRISEIDGSLGSVREPKPDGVVLDVACVGDRVVHRYSSGSIGLSGNRASARFQFSPSSARCGPSHSTISPGRPVRHFTPGPCCR